jgi:hypothetical protein
MTQHTTIERETVTEHVDPPRGVVEKGYAMRVAHGDEETSGVVSGAVGGVLFVWRALTKNRAS